VRSYFPLLGGLFILLLGCSKIPNHQQDYKKAASVAPIQVPSVTGLQLGQIDYPIPPSQALAGSEQSVSLLPPDLPFGQKK
jgi:hypothetical protein